jgi:hypothetical protein
MLMTYSRINDPSRPIAPISAARAREFLCQLANLREDQKAALRFKTRFGDLFLSEVPWAAVRQSALNSEAEGFADEVGKLADDSRPEWSEDDLLQRYWLLPLRDAIRAVWEAPDLLVKQWGVFTTLANYFTFGDRSLFVGPVQGPLEGSAYSTGPPGPCGRILLHLLKNADLTRRCGNPECPARYFFAARRSQKYCSTECSKPAQREAERRWWNKNGAAWRKARLAKQRRGKTDAVKRMKKGRA